MATMRLSNWLALRCKEAAFRKWLRVPDEATAVTAVRAICEVKSRSDIDKDPAAAKRFHQFIRLPYSNFVHNNQEQTCSN